MQRSSCFAGFFLATKGGLQSDVYENEKRILLELKQLWEFHQLLDSSSSHCNWLSEELKKDMVLTSITHLAKAAS
ncbi:hypothetical protein KY284_033039 [Solanum tuberosum]|nr:hypothetical protein KY284_033039 [Solanum tuberosum]